ncbi:MAG TPA: heme NO-binding domain-containing protein [Polyangium sp.]|nr:heme NO-binding domain-containing protein [Polyangium sp.]
MQGVIILGTQRFVRERFGAEFWRMVDIDANLGNRLYLPSQCYPMADVDAVISSVSRHSGMTIPMVLESVGDYVAPDLLAAYSGIIDPQWGLLDILLHGEAIIERAALRHGNPLPHSLIEARVGKEGEIIVAYQGPWRICPLVKGIFRGLGAHLNQPATVDELRCVSAGSRICEWGVKVERARAMRPRMTSVTGVGIVRTNLTDRPSSLPPAPAPTPLPRFDTKSSPGIPTPYRPERHTPLPPEPTYGTTRKTNLPPSFDSDNEKSGQDPQGNRRR